MAYLILVRHAKAIDRMDADDDFERGLTPRGRKDAKRAAEIIASAGLKPDLALVSPAQRTLQTLDAMRDHLGDPPVESPMALYHASPNLLVRAAEDALTIPAWALLRSIWPFRPMQRPVCRMAIRRRRRRFSNWKMAHLKAPNWSLSSIPNQAELSRFAILRLIE